MELCPEFNPTGGVINPISILIVNTIANQYGSKPNVVITGNNIAEVITITATGGKKKPAIKRKIFIKRNTIHLLELNSTML